MGPTNTLLFACVENLNENSVAANKYFDINTGHGSHLSRPGLDSNVITMSNHGTSICVAAENREKRVGEILFFDIRSGPKPTLSIESGGYTSDVSTMGFSPDDIYLALGKEDNAIEVWDSRFVSSTPFLKMKHFNGDLPQQETYGIARHLQWVEGRHRFGTGLGLVTGGDGGCVRLWDIQRAQGQPESESVLAESPFSISTLLIPDPATYPEVRLIL
jgi:WD40 repeat protein